MQLNLFQTKKHQGPDGLPTDFYKMFYIKLKDLLLDVYRECKKKRIFYDSARQGIISLIPKFGRDRLKLANWRPICLLNVDYKIVSKVMANRIKMVLDDIIDEEQSAYIKGRSISQNIRTLFDVIDLAAITNKPGIIVSVDFMKAFDRIEYSSLIGALKFFNFGENFIEWVRILFYEFNLATTNGGFLSSLFNTNERVFPRKPNISILLLVNRTNIINEVERKSKK